MGKRKHNHQCEFIGCLETKASWYEYEPDNGVWSCSEHAEHFGFCYMCGNFWAGCESFDFSRIKGVCENCISEFDDDSEQDWDDSYDDFSYQTGFDLIEGETYGVDISPDNDTMGGVE